MLNLRSIKSANRKELIGMTGIIKICEGEPVSLVITHSGGCSAAGKRAVYLTGIAADTLNKRIISTTTKNGLLLREAASQAFLSEVTNE